MKIKKEQRNVGREQKVDANPATKLPIRKQELGIYRNSQLSRNLSWQVDKLDVGSNCHNVKNQETRFVGFCGTQTRGYPS